MIPLLMATLLMAATPDPQVTAITHVRVFDGVKLLRNRTVVIRGTVIDSVSTAPPPEGALVIEGRTRTLVPGLIDSFVTENAGRNAAERAALFGVTSFLDAGAPYDLIVYNDGFAWGLRAPKTSYVTLHEAVERAQKARRLALVEVGSLREAKEAVKAEANGLVRIYAGPTPDLVFAKQVAARKVFLIPVLGLLENAAGMTPAPAPDPLLTAEEKARLSEKVPGKPRVEGGLATLRQLRKLHVPLVAGDGLGEPGTAPGLSLIHELELLVRAGFSPAEVLAAATSTPAKLFEIPGRGIIAEGARADLILVTGDPTRRIEALRDVLAVWKNGERVR